MRYKYKARTKKGKPRRGTIEASSEKAALYVLEKYGFYATSLRESGKEGFLGKKLSFRKISPKEIISFTRQLSVMLKSAISPVEALKSQVAQTENPIFREKILKMAEVVEGGGSLSGAFSLFPKAFDQFYINVIRSGEASGKVADSLTYLAGHLTKEYNLRQKVKSAMIYPAFVVVTFIAVFFLATFFIIPKLTDILKAFGGELPLATRIIIALSNFIKGGGWLLMIGIFFLVMLLPQHLKRSRASKEIYDKLLLKVPVLGGFTKKVNLTRFSENLSVLLRAGLPITQALKIIQEIIGNSVYQKIIAEAKTSVSRGEKISSVFSLYPEQVPPFVLQMISTGEVAGRLDETLMEIVDFYQQEIDRLIDRLPNIIEPVLILFLGIGIAVLAISVFIPLFKIGLGGMGT